MPTASTLHRNPASAQLTVRVSDDERAVLDRLAVEQRRSISFLVRDAVQAFIAREDDRP